MSKKLTKMEQFALLRPAQETDVIDEAAVNRILGVLSYGLPSGLGEPEPGKMCVEAAISYAMGYDHNDLPYCVDSDVADFKIDINDNHWSSNKARAEGLRAVAIAQLGSNALDDSAFVEEMLSIVYTRLVRYMLAQATVKGRRLSRAEIDRLNDVSCAVIDMEDRGETLHSSIAENLGDMYEKQVIALPTGKDRVLRGYAALAVEALTNLKVKGTTFLHLLDKKA